jgi:pyrroline-5-carboxylate reductase
MLVGAGALGSSLLKGLWLTRTVEAKALMILDLHPGEEAKACADEGARLNPPPDQWSKAKTVILAVKPQNWREVAQILSGNLGLDTVIISVMAGVRLKDLTDALAPLRVVRVMPTTGVATGAGVASLYADDETALSSALALFSPMATMVTLKDEALMDAATAVSGSGPAYVYVFLSALQKAAEAAGLSQVDARTLSRATLISAVKLLELSEAEPEDLINKVASPGGTTEAALKVLCNKDNGLDQLMQAAVMAAMLRAQELG